MKRGIALLVGLTSVDPDMYGGWDGTDGAEGCECDVDSMAKILSSAGDYTINILKTELATASTILNCIESAADTLVADDMFVFYYSGHGGNRNTGTSPQEPDGKDETLIVYDREIIDNELAKLWRKKFAPGVRIVMLSDSCNSGTNEGYITKVMGAKLPELPIQKLMPISFAEELPGMGAQLIHFGACRDGQTAIGYPNGSAFTLALVEVWNEEKGQFSGYKQLYGLVKARLAYDFIKAGLEEFVYAQEPQFSTHGNVKSDFLNSKPFSF